MMMQPSLPQAYGICFGALLRSLRNKAKLTQVQLLPQTNYSHTAISWLEASTRKPNYVHALVAHNDETDINLLLWLVLD